MSSTDRRWIALRVACLLAVLLLCAYAVERFADRLVEGPRPVLTAEASTPPPGAGPGPRASRRMRGGATQAGTGGS